MFNNSINSKILSMISELSSWLQDLRVFCLIYFLTVVILIVVLRKAKWQPSKFGYIYVFSAPLIIYQIISNFMAEAIKYDTFFSFISSEFATGLIVLRFTSVFLCWFLFKHLYNSSSSDLMNKYISLNYSFYLGVVLFLWIYTLFSPFDNLQLIENFRQNILIHFGHSVDSSNIDYIIENFRKVQSYNLNRDLGQEEAIKMWVEKYRFIVTQDGQVFSPPELNESIDKIISKFSEIIKFFFTVVSYCLFYIVDDWIIFDQYKLFTNDKFWKFDFYKVHIANRLILLSMISSFSLIIFAILKLVIQAHSYLFNDVVEPIILYILLLAIAVLGWVLLIIYFGKILQLLSKSNIISIRQKLAAEAKEITKND